LRVVLALCGLLLIALWSMQGQLVSAPGILTAVALFVYVCLEIMAYVESRRAVKKLASDVIRQADADLMAQATPSRAIMAVGVTPRSCTNMLRRYKNT
jgi:hypothetical protein